MVKAVIFDMDGLLIDSEPLWKESEIKTFNEIGVPLTRKMASETSGLREDEAIEHWYKIYKWKNVTPKEVEARITKKIIDLIKVKGQARIGVYNVIKIVKGKKLPMAIASASISEVINAVVDKLGIRQDMKVIHSAEHEQYGKPHPAVYITTAEKLNVDPESCLAFEDTPRGVLAAKSARMKCIAVPDEMKKGDKIFQIADVVLDTLEDFKVEYLGS